jgi:DNA-binding transcriptional MerR regulator
MAVRVTALEQFPIRTVSVLTGVKAITLRAWERRYGLIQPRRTVKGHRLYSHADVEQIRRVLTLLDRGIQIGRVGEVLSAEQRTDKSAGQKRPWQAYLDRMAGAVARFDEEELDVIYDEFSAVHSIEQLTEELLLPALAQLGERWARRAGGIAEEHFLASYLRSKLGARLQRPSRYARGPRLLVACAPLEHHEIGLLLFALEARAAGCRVIALGADNPLPELAAAQQQTKSNALVISSSVGTVSWVYEGELAALVRRVSVPVFIGGATAVTHRKAIVQSGAIPLGTEARAGLEMLMATLGRAAVRSRLTSESKSGDSE